MSSGEVLTYSDLDFKRPGTGVEPHRFDELIGKVLTKSIPADHILSIQDIQ